MLLPHKSNFYGCPSKAGGGLSSGLASIRTIIVGLNPADIHPDLFPPVTEYRLIQSLNGNYSSVST